MKTTHTSYLVEVARLTSTNTARADLWFPESPRLTTAGSALSLRNSIQKHSLRHKVRVVRVVETREIIA